MPFSHGRWQPLHSASRCIVRACYSASPPAPHPTKPRRVEALPTESLHCDVHPHRLLVLPCTARLNGQAVQPATHGMNPRSILLSMRHCGMGCMQQVIRSYGSLIKVSRLARLPKMLRVLSLIKVGNRYTPGDSPSKIHLACSVLRSWRMHAWGALVWRSRRSVASHSLRRQQQ